MHTSCINLVQARLEAVSLLAVLSTVGIVYHHQSTDFNSVKGKLDMVRTTKEDGLLRGSHLI